MKKLRVRLIALVAVLVATLYLAPGPIYAYQACWRVCCEGAYPGTQCYHNQRLMTCYGYFNYYGGVCP
jgi:hypothetical protein